MESGAIGGERGEVTREVFSLLSRADRSCYDHVLKEFLSALNPRNRWLLELPSVFSEVTELGRKLSDEQLSAGMTYFRLLGEGRLGSTPREVRHLVDLSSRLFQVDAASVPAFLRGYATLLSRLRDAEIDRFADQGLRILASNRDAGYTFLACESQAAESVIQSITRECRLVDVAPQMGALIRALAGYEVEVDDLGKLDSDELIELGSSFVCMYRWAYVPERIRSFAQSRANRAWYRLLAVVVAAMLSMHSLPAIHGHPECRTVADLTGGDLLHQNLVIMIEYARVVAGIRRRWPGARRLLVWAISAELTARPPVGVAERLLAELLNAAANDAAAVDPTASGRSDDSLTAELTRIIRQSVNVLDTIRLVRRLVVDRRRFAGLGHTPLRPLSFLPDFRYPAEVSSPEVDRSFAELTDEAEAAGRDRDEHDGAAVQQPAADAATAERGEAGDGEGATVVGYLYPEWSTVENDYLPDHCRLVERAPKPALMTSTQPISTEQVERVRRVFESLKPQIMATEKYREHGDAIDTDELVNYLVDRYREPSPRVRFYQKPVRSRRDPAVCILMDLSGSTAGTHGDRRVIDLEREATVLLAEGLNALGDRFEIAGFTTLGRTRCEYVVFKEAGETWNRAVAERLAGAQPSNSTRIGVALRHAGARLERIAARQRLVVLITDGKPMDEGYSPESRYAQYDVRAACEENERREIHTFGISTEENTVADMEIMFPRGRYATLESMRDLPAILPRLYLRLTA